MLLRPAYRAQQSGIQASRFRFDLQQQRLGGGERPGQRLVNGVLLARRSTRDILTRGSFGRARAWEAPGADLEQQRQRRQRQRDAQCPA